MLDAYFAGKEESAVIDINDGRQEYEELFLTHTAEHTRAFVKVQDGCNQFCSYCIIPYARGRVRSRKLADVCREVETLAEKGYKEVVLTGIHLSSYGVDIGDSLLELIGAIHKIPGIARIRLGSLEPKIITEEFVSEIARLPKLCPHFHLSLQSGCDETLKRMNRKYTTEEYERGCALLRSYFAHPAITTDVIVGFPGETEDEFQTTMAFLERIHFYEMHIFKYSKRQGTRAAEMKNQIPEEVKTARSAKLIALGERMSEEFRAYYLGREEEILFEEQITVDGKPYYVGFNREYVKAVADSAEDLSNQIRCGTITEMLSPELYAIHLN
jgi:threonylcarbamoyladenosine tRNA methylthiotransferase MtaB